MKQFLASAVPDCVNLLIAFISLGLIHPWTWAGESRVPAVPSAAAPSSSVGCRDAAGGSRVEDVLSAPPGS